MQPDETEVAGLVEAILVVEEQPHAIGRVIARRVEIVVPDEIDLGISVSEERDQPVGHAAGQLTAVLFPKLHRIGKPSHRVAERAGRKQHRDLAIARVVIVAQHLLVAVPDFDPEPDVIALGAGDPACPEIAARLEQDVGGVEIHQPHAPGLFRLGHDDAAAVVEVVAQTMRAGLRRRFRRHRVGGLGPGGRCRRRGGPGFARGGWGAARSRRSFRQAGVDDDRLRLGLGRRDRHHFVSHGTNPAMRSGQCPCSFHPVSQTRKRLWSARRRMPQPIAAFKYRAGFATNSYICRATGAGPPAGHITLALVGVGA